MNLTNFWGVLIVALSPALSSAESPAPIKFSSHSRPSVNEFFETLKVERDSHLLESPANSLITPQELERVLEEVKNESVTASQGPYSQVTKMITIDRKDRQACHEVLLDLHKSGLRPSRNATPAELCHNEEPKNRYVTLYLTADYDSAHRIEVRKDWLHRVNDTWLGSTDHGPLENQMRGMVIVGAGALLVLSALPEENTRWDRSNLKRPWKSYFDNVKQGPTKDEDNKFYNYVLHPYAGAAYYMQARTTGHSRLQSFGYSVVMSTIFWEFGYEAIMERPSKQDLVNTPIIGAFLGELFFTAHKAIENNNDQVLGSKALGRAIKFFLNPAGELAIKINYWLGRKAVTNATTFYGLGYQKNHLTGEVRAYPGAFLLLEW